MTLECCFEAADRTFIVGVDVAFAADHEVMSPSKTIVSVGSTGTVPIHRMRPCLVLGERLRAPNEDARMALAQVRASQVRGRSGRRAVGKAGTRRCMAHRLRGERCLYGRMIVFNFFVEQTREWKAFWVGWSAE